MAKKDEVVKLPKPPKPPKPPKSEAEAGDAAEQKEMEASAKAPLGSAPTVRIEIPDGSGAYVDYPEEPFLVLADSFGSRSDSNSLARAREALGKMILATADYQAATRGGA